MDAADVPKVMEMCREAIREELEYLYGDLAPDGVTMGDAELKNDAEFVAWYIDLATYPSRQFNTLTFLRRIAPKFTAQQDTRYARIMGGR